MLKTLLLLPKTKDTIRTLYTTEVSNYRLETIGRVFDSSLGSKFDNKEGNIMNLKELGEHFTRFADQDPMWCVLTELAKDHNRWDKKDFFKRGEDEI